MLDSGYIFGRKVLQDKTEQCDKNREVPVPVVSSHANKADEILSVWVMDW